jgi:hypothetical protein
MEPLKQEATQRSPRVDFDFDSGTFLMEGEIYPEDASSFFGPIMERLQAYLNDLRGAEITFDFKLVYFNSSSAKGLMNLFQMLEDAAQAGNAVRINWYYHEDDDTIFEAGEDFSEDLDKTEFRMYPMEVA